MQFKKFALSAAAIAALGVCGSASAFTSHEEQIIVHPFQWTYDMIADECEQVLGPKGFDGVQISQPAEHIDRKEVWWSVYQPVNFKNFTTMTGNEEQLRSMIKRCNAAGVKVYADAVFNHRAVSDSNHHYGSGGSYFDSARLQYPDLDPDDFNSNSCYIDYSDKWSIYNCAYNSMPDINVMNPGTQAKIADYLKSLMSMGVYGFRIDTAKHMPPEGIAAILAQAGNPFSYLEMQGMNGQAVQPGDYMNIPNTVITQFKYMPLLQQNIRTPKYLIGINDNWFDVNSDGTETFATYFDFEIPTGAPYKNYGYSSLSDFDLAQSFLVAWPYGKVRQVYSGYQLSANGNSGPFNEDRCQGGWNCEHRSSIVMNAAGFARATRGYGVSYKGASDDGKVIWFTRGDKGFYVMNSGNDAITWTFDTHMPDGRYCEILQQPGICDGQQITVKNGKAEIMVNAKSAAAICADDPNSRGFCGTCQGDGCPLPPVEKLYYTGTSNGWKFDEMNCVSGVCSIHLDLTDEGDENGPQRFKITSAQDWKHDIWGVCRDHTICSDEFDSGDIVIAGLKGSFSLEVATEGKHLTFKITQEGGHEPVAAFAEKISGRKVFFKDESFDEDGDPLSYEWDFGDGEGSSEMNPEHEYVQDGFYTVRLTVSDGRSRVFVEKTIQVKPECFPKYDHLYYAGTTNGWKHDAMTFDNSVCKWSIDLILTGLGDSNGAQRFKVTTAPNWKDKVYGSQDGKTLCRDQSKCGDIRISKKGSYKLLVDDNAKTWEFVKNSGTYIAPTRDAMYYAGTTNKWTHEKMSYNSETGDWEITLNLTGNGDSHGGQRFKVTSAANWKGTVWGDAGGNSLCSNQSSCGDVYIAEVGTYVLKVNDKELTWVLDPK